MSEEMYMTNYLSILKSNVEVYVHGTIESSNDNIRKLLKNGLDKTLECQKSIYNLMVDCKYYNVDNIDSDTIKKTYDKLENK